MSINLKMFFVFLLAFVFCLPGLGWSETMTRQQGDAILKELRSIRQLLQKQQQVAKPKPQRPKRARMPLADGVVLGAADAPVTIIEFTDYQCPYCKRFYDQTFSLLKKEYIDTGKLRFVSRNLPLPFHKNAMDAARAASCAGEQGRYWDMRQILFANTTQLGKDKLPDYADRIEIDVSMFRACLDSTRYVDKVEQDKRAAAGVGITGTPSFVLGRSTGNFVEGNLLIGAQPYAVFKSKIESLLKNKK